MLGGRLPERCIGVGRRRKAADQRVEFRPGQSQRCLNAIELLSEGRPVSHEQIVARCDLPRGDLHSSALGPVFDSRRVVEALRCHADAIVGRQRCSRLRRSPFSGVRERSLPLLVQ